MRMPILTAIILSALLAQPTLSAQQQFKDVPKDHWAAEYVAKVASDGIMNGYPSSKFKGDKAVTRYELAVALVRMVEVIENSLKPEIKGESAKAESQGAPSPQPSPVKGEGARTPLALSSPRQGAVSKGDPAQRLKSGGYIAADSPLLKDRNKSVSPTELAQALSSVAAKLIEKTIPPPKDQM